MWTQCLIHLGSSSDSSLFMADQICLPSLPNRISLSSERCWNVASKYWRHALLLPRTCRMAPPLFLLEHWKWVCACFERNWLFLAFTVDRRCASMAFPLYQQEYEANLFHFCLSRNLRFTNEEKRTYQISVDSTVWEPHHMFACSYRRW